MLVKAVHKINVVALSIILNFNFYILEQRNEH